MGSHVLRWALMSVAALLVLLSLQSAEAEKKVVVGPNTTLDGLARKYGVPKAEIAKANGIKPEAILRDGQTLRIPDPPPVVRVPSSLDLSATVKGNRIALRRGPGTEYSRITLLDHGAQLRVTAKRGDWYQVSGPQVPHAWIRADFLNVQSTKAAAPQSQADTRVSLQKQSEARSQPATSSVSSGTAAAKQEGVINGDRVSLRSGPGRDSDRLALLENGTRVTVLAQQADWYRVRTATGKTGWVLGTYVATMATPSTSQASRAQQSPATGGVSASRHANAPATQTTKQAALATTTKSGTAAGPVERAIKGDRVSLRSGPSRDSERLALLDNGARITLLERRADWCRVRTEAGKTGWVLGTYVATAGRQTTSSTTRSEPSPLGPRVICGDRVCIRTKPDRSSERLTLLDDGAQVKMIGRKGDWCRIKLASGKTGWVLNQYLGMRSRSGVRVASEPKRVAQRPLTQTREVRRATPLRHVRQETPAPDGEEDFEETPRQRDVVRTAFTYRGTRYRYGGSSRGGFDCSGFTRYVYSQKGISLPHRAAEQFRHGKPVSKSELKPGDLVFFQTTRRGISHVGIYAGNGKFIHASSAKGRVRVDSLTSGYYAARYRGARRVN